MGLDFKNENVSEGLTYRQIKFGNIYRVISSNTPHWNGVLVIMTKLYSDTNQLVLTPLNKYNVSYIIGDLDVDTRFEPVKNGTELVVNQ